VKQLDSGEIPLRASLIYLNFPDAWPLVVATYILVVASPKASADARRTQEIFYWAFLKGDDIHCLRYRFCPAAG
jgi:hypothetical protein